MSKNNKQRLIKEMHQCQQLEKEQIAYFYCDEENSNKWDCFLLGPDKTAYEKGIFELSIRFPEDYPISAPQITFVTCIFHPNIHQETGEICLEVLKNDWRPYWTIQSIMRAIQFLLMSPNSDSPLNCDAGNLLRNDEQHSFNQMASLFTATHALDKQDFLQYRTQLYNQYQLFQ